MLPELESDVPNLSTFMLNITTFMPNVSTSHAAPLDVRVDVTFTVFPKALSVASSPVPISLCFARRNSSPTFSGPKIRETERERTKPETE